MPYFFDRDHYATVTQLLVAGDVQARVVQAGVQQNGAPGFGVEVTLEDQRKVVWSNQERQKWFCSIVEPSGDISVAGGDLDMATTPEDVARYIATYEYPEVPTDEAVEAKVGGDDESGC